MKNVELGVVNWENEENNANLSENEINKRKNLQKRVKNELNDENLTKKMRKGNGNSFELSIGDE